MRLLRLDTADKFSLVEYWGSNIPKYAILSHTWGADHEEVTMRDLQKGKAKSKSGYRKLIFCGQQTAKHGLKYFWVDTCCIDKKDSVELSEAINSMFKWYKQAQICFTYLADVSTLTDLRGSRWFTRGWTLQELLAPADVHFFTNTGMPIGSKLEHADVIHNITRIPVGALKNGPLELFSVEERMSWVKGRETKREEDLAYCLFGLFDVHMSLIYGEGQRKAFARLRREIRESSEDVITYGQNRRLPIESTNRQSWSILTANTSSPNGYHPQNDPHGYNHRRDNYEYHPTGNVHGFHPQINPHAYHPELNQYGYHPEFTPYMYHPDSNPYGYHPAYNIHGYHPESNIYGYHPKSNRYMYHPESNPYGYHPGYNIHGYHPESNPYMYHPKSNPYGYHPESNPYGYHLQLNPSGYHPQLNPSGCHPLRNPDGYHPKHNKRASHPTHNLTVFKTPEDEGSSEDESNDDDDVE